MLEVIKTILATIGAGTIVCGICVTILMLRVMKNENKQNRRYSK